MSRVEQQKVADGKLKYLLTRFNKYDIIYLSFHGQTHAIHLEGEKEDLSLDELIEMGGSVFENRFVHFSSCRTLIGSSSTAISFKEKTGAKLLSGYSKSVDGALSAVHDIALFGEYLQRVRLSCIAKNMEKNFGELVSITLHIT